MSRAIEVLAWKARLAIADYSRVLKDRAFILRLRTPYEQKLTFARFVDRVSPFSPRVGYKRVELRRWLYRLRFPLTSLRFAAYSVGIAIADRIVEPMGLGRYEAMNPSAAIKTEWLDSHSEYANETTGDSDLYVWAALFHLIEVPWSFEPQTWVITVDSRGSVSSETGHDAIDLFTYVSRT